MPTGYREHAYDLVLLQSESNTDFFAYYNNKFFLRMSYDQTSNLLVIKERIPLPEHLDLILKLSFDAYQKIFSSKHMLIKDGLLLMLARNSCAEGTQGSEAAVKDDALAISLVSIDLEYPYEFTCKPLSEIMEQNKSVSDQKETIFM